jgi:SAM-dependent methyltransferase
MTSIDYVGGELEIFAEAQNWKAYMASLLQPWIRGTVLEVGAGLGATAQALWHPPATRWVCLEPDPAMATGLQNLRLGGATPVDVINGTVADLTADQRFETILYIDVLEHIDDDRAELATAAQHLARGGDLVVLSPAFQSLYSEFDRAIGHYRRYTARSLSAVFPSGLRRQTLQYADCAGAMLSFANRLMLRQSMPTRRQVRFWDRVVLPVSRLVDPMIGRRFGRSVIAVYRHD